MITLSYSIEGMEGLKKRLEKLSDAVQIVEVLDEAEAIILNRVRARFLAEVDTDGNPWVPSAAGLARKAKGGTGTLFDTGTLFHSIQAYASGPDSREIGTDVPYGPNFQYGINGQIQREFLGVSEDDSFVVEKRILQRIEEALA